MIQCPNCQTGLLWGVFLDIPLEMKSGEAEWVACEPPEPEKVITCPKCEQVAGPYRKLFEGDRESRKLVRVHQQTEHLQNITVGELPSFTLLGVLKPGNYLRKSFLNENWQEFCQWLKILQKTRIVPAAKRDLEEPTLPGSIGLRLDDIEEVSPSQCRYLASIPIAEEKIEKITTRLENPEYNDLKHAQILHIDAGLYAKYHFHGEPEEFHKTQKILLKTWFNEQKYKLRPGPFLELYSERLKQWPPQMDDVRKVIITLCIPIEEIPKQMESPQESEDDNQAGDS